MTTFPSSAPLRAVLAWPELPAVLRRSLTRALPAETLDGVAFGESVRRWKEPPFREWIVALLAHDVGIVGDPDTSGSLIGLFSHGRMEAELSGFHLPVLAAGQGLGASYRAPSPVSPATVCAAAFVYRDAQQNLESDFVFLSGATPEPVVQLELSWEEGRSFDERHLDDALGVIAAQVEAPCAAEARAVVREALLECLARSRSDRAPDR